MTRKNRGRRRAAFTPYPWLRRRAERAARRDAAKAIAPAAQWGGEMEDAANRITSRRQFLTHFPARAPVRAREFRPFWPILISLHTLHTLRPLQADCHYTRNRQTSNQRDHWSARYPTCPACLMPVASFRAGRGLLVDPQGVAMALCLREGAAVRAPRTVCSAHRLPNPRVSRPAGKCSRKMRESRPSFASGVQSFFGILGQVGWSVG